MMKKLISLLTAAALVFALAACGRTAKTESTDSVVADTLPGAAPGGRETPTQSAMETTAPSEASKTTTSAETIDTNGKILIVYFSWSSSGNTEKMAAYIQEQTGGDLLELEPLNPYPTDYGECGDVALVERDENARPEIANLPESISEYDTVFVGYPIWWHTAPMIIGTFLESYDLTGVEIYPFTQSASMDTEQFDNSMEFVRENANGANVHDGLFVEAEDTDGIWDYLTANGFAE